MIVEIRVPDLGESINEVEIGEWLIEVGDTVHQNDSLVAIESEKATVELPATEDGVLVEIPKRQGESAQIGEVIGRLDTEAVAKPARPDRQEPAQTALPRGQQHATETTEPRVMPAAARVLAQQQVPVDRVTPTGPGGRILKEDAAAAADRGGAASHQSRPQEPPPAAEAEEHREPMSLLRRTIAARLLEVGQSTAMLTTFNEADMSAVKRLRRELGAAFAEKHSIRLGFMPFFVKASVAALNDFPLVNARIDGNEIVFHHHCDIGVAIGTGKGLVVPVLRRAEQLSFARIERQIAQFGEKANNNTLTPDELRGGTFTISNGGVYGSMLSTPILNPSQSAILGLHAIQDRPVAIDGQVEIRPVMYLALTYDHRIIDGREAVSFLKTIKQRIEQPEKLLLEI